MQTLAAAMRLTDNYTVTMAKIIKSTETAEQKIQKAKKVNDQFADSFKKVKSGAEGANGGISSLMTKLTGMIGLAYAGKKAFDAMIGALNTSATQKIQETTFGALLHNDKVGSRLYQYVGQYAKASSLGREDIAKGVTSFLTVTRDLNEVERLIKMTERLYAKDPTQGAEGAVFALKEVLAGDVISMRNRYGITGFSGEKIREMSAQGDTAGLLDYMDEQLNRFGATQEIVDKNFTNLLTQTNVFATNMKTAVGDTAKPVMENLASVMQRLNGMMEAGKFQPFINLMVNGMRLIGNGIAWVVENLNWIAPTVVGLVGALVIYKTAMMAVSAAQFIAGLSAKALLGDWVGLAIMAGSIVAATAIVATTMNDLDTQLSAGLSGFDKDALAKDISAIPVEVTNSSPVPVTGEVSIDSEDMRYLIDLESQRFFAKFSVAHLAPNITNNFGDIHQTANLEDIEGHVVGILTEEIETAAEGVYD